MTRRKQEAEDTKAASETPGGTREGTGVDIDNEEAKEKAINDNDQETTVANKAEQTTEKTKEGARKRKKEVTDEKGPG